MSNLSRGERATMLAVIASILIAIVCLAAGLGFGLDWLIRHWSDLV